MITPENMARHLRAAIDANRLAMGITETDCAIAAARAELTYRAETRLLLEAIPDPFRRVLALRDARLLR